MTLRVETLGKTWGAIVKECADAVKGLRETSAAEKQLKFKLAARRTT